MSHRIYDTPQERERARKQRYRDRQRQARAEAAREAPPEVDHDDAFDSHEWEDMEGSTEAHCAKCGTATSWPLAIMRMCTGSSSEGLRKARPHITVPEVLQAIEYREQGLTWDAVGVLMNRCHSGVSRAIRAYQAGNGRLAAEAERLGPTYMREGAEGGE